MGTEDSGLSEFFRVQSETTDESGSSNHLFSQLRDIHFSEGNVHDIFAEPSVGSGSGGHLETYPELNASIGGNDFFDINPEVVDGSGGHIDSDKHMVMHPNNPFYQSDLFFPTRSLKSVSSSSSSLVSSEDLFQVDTKGLSKPRLRTTSSLEDEQSMQPASKDDINDIFSHKTCNSSELKNASQCSTSTGQVSQVTHELPTQSPPIQVMDRSGPYDPQRIPSSAFDSNKSPTALDWSVASNESLFSLQLGVNSFSRDQVLVLGSELFKSGELTKSNELLMFSPNPLVPEMETDKKSVELEKTGATGESAEMIKDTTNATVESQSQEKSSSVAAQAHSWTVSDESGTSSHSFAFPIKKKKKKKCAWPSCYCSNCSCTFCYRRWPSCYCSNCSWAFCYSWSCSKKGWCCHSCIILTGGLKNFSVKVDAEMPQQESLAPEVTPKSTCCNWFPCCSPCSSYCHFRCCSPCPSCCHFRCCSPCPSCCHFRRCCRGCSCC